MFHNFLILEIGRPGLLKMDHAVPGFYPTCYDKHASESVRFTCDPDTVYKRLVQLSFFRVCIPC